MLPQPGPDALDAGVQVNGFFLVVALQAGFGPKHEPGAGRELLGAERQEPRELLVVGNEVGGPRELLGVGVHVGLHHHHFGPGALLLVAGPDGEGYQQRQRNGQQGH